MSSLVAAKADERLHRLFEWDDALAVTRVDELLAT